MKKKKGIIVGVDEVGRGPLAGPVVAGAVILDPQFPIEGLADSKVLTAKSRERLYELIINQSQAWAIGRAEVSEITEINILQASLLAMERAVNALTTQPDHALIDGNRCPSKLPCTSEAIIQGDGHIPEIMAASIIAKVTRDREMIAMDTQYPGYDFASHKGYGTAKHREAIKKLGPCKIHRPTFSGVKAFHNL